MTTSRQNPSPTVAKHTPGPWRETTEPPPTDENPRLSSRSLGDANYDDVAEISGATEADFHLIAAAPDLLEVAEAVVEEGHAPSCETNGEEPYCICMVGFAAVAIAKARGET